MSRLMSYVQISKDYLVKRKKYSKTYIGNSITIRIHVPDLPSFTTMNL